MDVSVRGTYPGNAFDITPYVELSDVSDNFTSADIYEYRRSIKVSLQGVLAHLCQCRVFSQRCTALMLLQLKQGAVLDILDC